VNVADLSAATISEDALVGSVCRDSLYEFVREFWGEIIDEPFVDNWHIEYLCCELEKVAEQVFNRRPRLYDLLINIAPGTTKSTIISVMFPAWCWTRAVWVQTICGSYAQELSLDLSTKCRAVVQSAKFKRCFPKLRIRDDQNTKTLFQLRDVGKERGGWRYATSTGGSVTGRHGHIIVIDDPVDPQGAVSEAELKEARDWLTNVIPKRRVHQDMTVTIMIMQRLSPDDPSGLWLEWKKDLGLPIKEICLPAELGDNIQPKKLARFYKNGLMDPQRLGRETLRAQRLIGEHAYAAQYLQKPVPPGGGMFKVDRIGIETIDYSGAAWRLVRYWDKAGTKDGGLYTVGLLMGVKGMGNSGPFYVLDVVRGQWEAAERERIIKQTAQQDGHRVQQVVEQEPGSGGKESAQATARSLAGFRVRLDRVGAGSGNKIQRADPYATQVNAGNVILQRADWNRAYLRELAEFRESSRYKDQVDASSGAFSFLTRSVQIGVF